MPDTSASTQISRPAGRPREFDIAEALDKAIIVFSERGYHATSIAELAAAMELAPGSLYKAFRDKKAIFLAAFDRYKQVRNALLDTELAKGTDGRDRVCRMLRFYAEASHGDFGRRGCIVVGAATELTAFDAEAAERVARSHKAYQTLLERLIREGQADGSISSEIDALAIARLMLCLTQGLRVVGKTGTDRASALGVVDAAMKLLD